MTKQIQIRIKNVYGTETIYPACETSELLAELAGTKTITRKALDTIKQLGYQVQQII